MSKYQFGSIVDRSFRNTLQRLADDASAQGKAIQDLVAEGQLTPEQYAKLIEIVNGLLKSGEINKYDLSESLRNQIESLAKGSPSGVFHSYESLIDAYPNGANGIYVVTNDGNWYFWDGNTWALGGKYQSTGLSTNDIVNRIPGTGEVKYVDGDPVQINTSPKEIIFPSYNGSPSRLVVNGVTYTLTSENSRIAIPDNVSLGRLLFNTQTQTFRVLSLFSGTANSYDYLVMTFRLTNPQHISFNGPYQIDEPIIERNYKVTSGMAQVVGSGTVNIKTDPRSIVFPSANGQRTWLTADGVSYELDESNSTLFTPQSDYGNVVGVYFNADDETLTAYRWTEETADNEHLVMMLNFLTTPVSVSYIGDYTVDGQGDADHIKEEVEDELSLSLLRYNLEDAIYSWWAFPIAKRYVGFRDKTYVCYTDSEGYTGVASIDNESGQVVKRRLKKKDVDDHNAGAVGILDDGRIMAVYASGHNQDNNMYVRISSKMESVEEFDDEIIIPITNGSAWDNRTTYAQLLYKNGKHFLFFRTGNTNWTYMYTENGTDWSVPIKYLTAGMQYYCKIVDTTDDDLLRIVMYSNPNETDYDMRLGFFDTSTMEFKLKDNTVVGTSEISKDEFPIILPRDGDLKQRLLDVAVTNIEETIIAYATFTRYANIYTPSPDVTYKIAYHTDTLRTVDVTHGGYPFYYASAYVGGVVFGYDNNTIFLSRQEGDTGVWYIEKWQTTDNGLSWTMTEEIHRSKQGSVAIRPVIEEDGDKVFWQDGYYDIYSFNNNNVDLKHSKVRDI